MLSDDQRKEGKQKSEENYETVVSFLGGTVASFHTASQATSRSKPCTPLMTASAISESA